ncbi:MAG TPA: hypothetical protein VKU83_03855 [Puia sp.]|nr:hypothetical protein [Puia sp.]
MKKRCLSFLLFPFTAFSWLSLDPTSINLADVRTGEWPIRLEKDIDDQGATYSLIFRDQQLETAVVMDTLVFQDLAKLRYFAQALEVLKKGHNGDIANFKNFTLKRADKRFDGVWYMLRIKYGLTDFQQPEADIMCKTIDALKQ